MAIYNPKHVVAVVGGIIPTGYGADTMIECSNNEDLSTLTINGGGKGTFNINPNLSGVVKITLMHNSLTLPALSALGLNKLLPFPISIVDANSLSGKVIGINCMLKKMPDMVRAKEVGTVELEFNCEKLVIA